MTVLKSKKKKQRRRDLAARFTDRRFQEELFSGVRALSAAVNRSQRLGAAKAAEDPKVARLVRQARAHLGLAVKTEPKPQRKRRVLRKVLVVSAVAGAGVAAAAGRTRMRGTASATT